MTTDPVDLHIRPASPADRPRLIPVINAAFAIETFLEGTRTDDEHLAAMMQKGEILLVEDSSGQILACIYAETHGTRGYLGMLAVNPLASAPASANVCSAPPKITSAQKAARPSTFPSSASAPSCSPSIVASASPKPEPKSSKCLALLKTTRSATASRCRNPSDHFGACR